MLNLESDRKRTMSEYEDMILVSMVQTNRHERFRKFEDLAKKLLAGSISSEAAELELAKLKDN